MKSLGLSVVLLSLFLAGSASAQTEEGPFASRQHLESFWATNSAGSPGAIHVFLNQHRVYSHPGFGPALGKSYFRCADGLIRKNCNSISGPFLSISDAVAYVDSVYGGHSHFWMLLDGASFLGVPFSPVAGTFKFMTCYGGPYNGYTLTYVVLAEGNAWNWPLTGISCLPPP
ncbi:hypothetical protein [Hyalangium gracile]|uniref:hypothetical protein n=1 Tax=Hyalangium gracile TaxID=394092 RepID=UPI001CCE1206|nr:hypothetical protein [Hyalangium gracile]